VEFRAGSIKGLDANGNTFSDPSGKSYSWDFENRLTQAVVPGTGTVAFKYDPFGRRIQKSGPLGTTNYLYDGFGLSAGVIEAVDNGGNLLARYTQGPGVDQPLAQLQAGTTSYFEQDGLGSVSTLSNPSATLANTYTYDAYGKLTSSTGAITNAFEYTGRETDPEDKPGTDGTYPIF
jgi:YD repeat-containing protein